MDTRETPATKATDTAAPQRVLGGIYAFEAPKTVLTKEKIIFAHMPIVTQKQRVHMRST